MDLQKEYVQTISGLENAEIEVYGYAVEYDVIDTTNLKITLKVQNLLEQSGCNVILTRSDENAIYDLDSQTLKQKKISDIHNRVKIGNESSADIFVSIHLNKIPQQQYYGWQCFYKPNDENSIKLAKLLQENLNKSIQKDTELFKKEKEEVKNMKDNLSL